LAAFCVSPSQMASISVSVRQALLMSAQGVGSTAYWRSR
jgi:hypothetical protein